MKKHGVAIAVIAVIVAGLVVWVVLVQSPRESGAPEPANSANGGNNSARGTGPRGGGGEETGGNPAASVPGWKAPDTDAIQRLIDLRTVLDGEADWSGVQGALRGVRAPKDGAGGELRSLVEACAELEGGRARDLLFVGLLDQWSRSDPSGAKAWLTEAMKADRTVAQMFEAGASALCESAPEVMLGLVERLNFGTEADWLRRKALVALARQSPEDAIVRMQGVGDTHRLLGLSEIALAWAKTEPELAAEFFDTLPESDVKYRATGSLAGLMMESDPEEALRRVEALPERWQSGARRTMMETWGAYAPEDAANFMLDLPDVFQHPDAMFGTIVTKWARAEPKAASEWALNLMGDKRKRALESVLPAMVAADVNAGLDFLLALPQEEVGAPLWHSTFNQAVVTMARTDPPLAASMVADGEFSDSTRRVIARHWAAEDPAGAAAWIEGSLVQQTENRPARNHLGHLCSIVARAWGEKDAAAARQWCQSLPDPYLRRKALAGVEPAD